MHHMCLWAWLISSLHEVFWLILKFYFQESNEWKKMTVQFMWLNAFRHWNYSLMHDNTDLHKLALVHRLSEYCDNTLANTPNSDLVMQLLYNIHCINSINLHVKLEVSKQYIIVGGCTI